MESNKLPENVLFGHNVLLKNVVVVNGASSFAEAEAVGSSLAPSSIGMLNGKFVPVQELQNPKEIDCDGLYLIPGMIDLQLNDMEWLDKQHTPEEHIDRFLVRMFFCFFFFFF